LDRFALLQIRAPESVKASAKIEETLDALPEAYTRTIFSEKCSRVFEHVYETRAS
jgi:hypothetical protein